jgi:L-amino acid N-acyltransferase
MLRVDCTLQRHGAAILDIFNEAIANSTALYDYHPRSMEQMVAWFQVKTENRWPVIGFEDQHGTLLGFTSYGAFRAWPAYKYSVEHSLYVHASHRGQGIGRALLTEIIQAARANQLHMLVGGIDAANTASIELHKKFGFQHCGTVREAGFKFGRWLDLAFYQRILDTPATPADG